MPTKRPLNKLTDLECQAAKPGDPRLSDGGSLYLLPHKNGQKYWQFRFNWLRPGEDGNGKKVQRNAGLGVYPETSLALARKKRTKARNWLAEGKDPILEFQKEREAKRDSQLSTFRAVAKAWWDTNVGRNKWTEHHSQSIWRSLEAHIFPRFGSRPVDDISQVEVYKVLQALDGQMPIRMKGRVSAVFRYAKTRGLTKDNPADIDADDLVVSKTRHYKALAFDEIPEFLSKVKADDCSRQLEIACILLIHLFLRRNEVRRLRWSYLDKKKRLLQVPGEDMKMDRDHEVPLSDEVIALLDELESITGDYPFLFPHRDRPHLEPMGESSMYSVLVRTGYQGKCTLHGFRTTASSALNNAGYNGDAIERQLAHKDSSVRGIYNKAQYMEERRTLMEAWSKAVATGEMDRAKT